MERDPAPHRTERARPPRPPGGGCEPRGGGAGGVRRGARAGGVARRVGSRCDEGRGGGGEGGARREESTQRRSPRLPISAATTAKRAVRKASARAARPRL